MARPSSAPRHRSRQATLQVLYAADLAPEPDGEAGSEAGPVDAIFDRVTEHFELPEGARAFAKELAVGVAATRTALDELLTRHARNWRLSRMAVVDRNILRLGAYELVHTETPASVVIDEAIELARRFGGESSPGFVNGVLDGVAGEVRETVPVMGGAA